MGEASGLIAGRAALRLPAMTIPKTAKKHPEPPAFNCALLQPYANIQIIFKATRNKISIKVAFRVFLSKFSDCLPSFPVAVRVEGMKTSHTLIQLRQHRSLCLVSARLPG